MSPSWDESPEERAAREKRKAGKKIAAKPRKNAKHAKGKGRHRKPKK